MAEKEKEPTVHIIQEPVFPSSFSQALSFLSTLPHSSPLPEKGTLKTKIKFAEISNYYIIVKCEPVSSLTTRIS